MISKNLILFLLIISIILPACGAKTPSNPAATPTLEPTFTQIATITPLPTFTPTETPTLVPATPTFGPPVAVANFYVKKAKCILVNPAPGSPYYRVEIWFRLAWQDMSDNEDGFWLYRDGNRVAELPANTTVYEDIFEIIKGGRASTYYVVAYNSAGQTKGESLSYQNPC